jgi:hypothetical protein
MVRMKWTYELLIDFFAEKGHKLLAKEYTTYEAKYDYQCKCSNSLCSINIGNLRLGKDNCKLCTLQKFKATNLDKYGTEHPVQSVIVKEKIKATNVEKYGFECSLQSSVVQEKVKATNIERYGYEHALQNAALYEKFKATNLETYGYEYPMQNTEVFERQQKAAFKRKPYKLPSGQEIDIQGYEAFALDLLISQNVTEDDLLMGFSTMPRIMYEHNEKTHRYFPDIFIPSQKKIVEVKSEYTYENAGDVTHFKMQACRSAGYAAEIWIFSREGVLLRVVNISSPDFSSSIPRQYTSSVTMLKK